MANTEGAAPPRRKKRAIALGGGGPAAGFLIGSLSALEENGVSFDVWALSCIGAWVGVYYNQLKDARPTDVRRSRADRTYDFFREGAFRDAGSYRGFPVNKAFAPNMRAFLTAWFLHAVNPSTYVDVFNIKNELTDVAKGWERFLTTPKMWMRESDVNLHVLNNILAVHPVSRFYTSLAYLSTINGLSNIYYPDSTFLEDIDVGRLDLLGDKKLDLMSREQLVEVCRQYDPGRIDPAGAAMPEIYHNAWRQSDQTKNPPVRGELRLFNNKWARYWSDGKRPEYLPITRASLCSSSALPYVEQTVKIPNDGNNEYSEGALIDTVNFANLVEDHADLDEIWVCRIVDNREVHCPQNLHDSLGNLCEQFAAVVGHDDVKLFKTHLRKRAGRIPRVVEIKLPKSTKINFRWDRDNLDNGFEEGRAAVLKLLDQPGLKSPTTTAPPW